MKINNVKEDQGEKLIKTLIFPRLPSAHEVLKDGYVVHIIEFFLHQRT